MVLVRLSFIVMLVAGAVTADAAELEIVNSSAKTIHELYVARVRGKGWGEDRLAGAVPAAIAPGGEFTVSDIPAGEYDLRLVDEDERQCEIYKTAIVSIFRLEFTDALLDKCSQESH